jgi:hypothetical protein
MQFISNQQLMANARRAYDEGRLTAQQTPEHAQCVYSLRINDRDCYCVLGASLPPETLQKLIEREANAEPIKRLLYHRRSSILGVEFESEDFAEDLQHAHDEWCGAVQEDRPPEHAERQFLELIGRHMTATNKPPLEMLPNMRNVAAVIAKDARENLAGVDVISIGPLWGELAPGGMQYSGWLSRSKSFLAACRFSATS